MIIRKRKHTRLKNYNYAQNGAYFVTICTKDRACVLCEVTICTNDGGDASLRVGRDDLIPPQIKLKPYGRMVEENIATISEAYPTVSVEKYVIMPNHVHLLLSFSKFPLGGMGSSRPTNVACEERMESSCEDSPGECLKGPTLMMVIRALKRRTTQAAKKSLWQDGFYEHIIRDSRDLLNHLHYMDNNPAKWAEDEYYVN